MRARGWALAAVVLALAIGMGLSAVAAKPVLSAAGSAWFLIPPIPGAFPHGADAHLVFSVHGYADGTSAGNAMLQLFDVASGKLTAVLTAMQQPWLDGGRVWGVQWGEPWVHFWTQLELREGWVPPLLLKQWTWWAHDGEIDEIALHSLGPFEVLKGNVIVHVQ